MLLSDNKLVTQEIKKVYKNNYILNGFSFEANPFEINYLAGINGAGKSTWVRIAMGLEIPEAGHIIFNGKNTFDTKDKLSVVFDEPPVYSNLTGYENLNLLSGIYNIKQSWKSYVLQSLRLEDSLLSKKTKYFSLGQRHRLAVASALMRQPSVLILDEPTVGLDPESWVKVSKIMRELADEGSTVIVTGHNYPLIAEIADKITILHNGVTIFTGSITELTEQFPPSIHIRIDNPDLVLAMYPKAKLLNDKKGQYLEIKCSSLIEANEISKKIQENNIFFYELTIQRIDLQEAFQKTISKYN